MKKKVFSLIWMAAISVCLLLPGCVSGADQTNMPVQTQLSVATAFETITPSQTSTRPPTEQQVTPLQTPTGSQPTEPTMEPTLTEGQRKDFTVNQLRNVKDCRLPCWWNIRPGVTSWSTTEDFFHQLGSRTTSDPLDNDVIFHIVGGLYFLIDAFNMDVYLLEKEAIVEGIQVVALRSGNPDLFNEAWQQYSPTTILEDYGIPDRVYLYVFDGTGMEGNSEYTFYHLWLVYDELGFFIKYTGQAKYEPVIHICPEFKQAEGINIIGMVLQPPDTKLALEKELDGTRDYDSKGMKSLEEVTQLTPEDLYNRLTVNEKDRCFDTELKVWQR